MFSFSSNKNVKIFLSFVIGKKYSHFKLKLFRKNILERDICKDIDNGQNNTIAKDTIEYIKELKAKYKDVYIICYISSPNQSISLEYAKDNKKDECAKREVVVDNSWSIKAFKKDISSIRDMFLNVEVDCIYSTYIILYKLANRSKEKIKGKICLYLLIEKNSMTAMIFKDKSLLYNAISDFNLAVSENITILEYIVNKIRDFYQYYAGGNDFIEQVGIHSDVELDKTLQYVIQEKLFMRCYVNKFSLLDEMIDIARENII